MGLYEEAALALGKTKRQIKRLVEAKKLPKASVGKDLFMQAVYEFNAGVDIRENFENTRNDTKEEVLSTHHVTSMEQLLSLMEIDELEWEVDKVITNYWGKPGNDNLQLKAILKRNNNVDLELLKEVFEKLKSPKKFPPKKWKKKKGKCMMQVNIFDLHYGKLCWAPESGENYDSKIARKRFMDAIWDFIEYAKPFNVKEVWFPIGNDFFNSDTVQGTTTAGTPQHDDVRWQRTYHDGCQLLIDGIELLRQHVGEVFCFNVPGNHDMQKSYCATLLIDAHYRHCKDVKVDISPAKHKAYSFGDCSVMFTHGDRIKQKELVNDFIVLFPEIWSSTKFREIHIGHEHHEYVWEDKGVKVRKLPSLSGTDAYHFNAGYVGSLQQAQSFIWHEDNGLIANFNSTVK